MKEMKKDDWHRVAELYTELALIFMRASDFSQVDDLLDKARGAVGKMREARE